MKPKRRARFVATVAAVGVALVSLAPAPPVSAQTQPGPHTFNGGVYVAVGDVNGDGVADIITGPGGGTPIVRVFDGVTAQMTSQFLAFPSSFQGGVRVASGDVNNDGKSDIIVGAGPGGGPHVRVLDAVTRQDLLSFFAFTPGFSGGVNVAAGDVNADGKADVIVGAGAGGGPHVRVFDGTTNANLFSFFAFPAGFSGGVQVASADFDGDRKEDIVVGAGAGGGPHVRVVNSATLQDIHSFFAFAPVFSGGVNVAAGDLNGDHKADILVGAGPGGGPHVRAFEHATLAQLQSFFAYTPGFSGGVRVAAGDIKGNQVGDMVLGAGPGGGAHVRAVNPSGGDIFSFFAY